MVKNFSSSKDLKLSEKLIFRVVYHHGPLTKNEIVTYTDGSLSTIQRLLHKLEESEVILPGECKKATGGRKSKSYKVNPNAFYAFGAYITWDVYGVGLVSIDGKVLKSMERRTSKDLTPSEAVAFLHRAVEEIIADTEIERNRILGMTFSSPGPLKKDKGILYSPHHLELSYWEVVPIKDMLEISTGFSVLVNNLSNSALFGELMNHTITTELRAAYILIDKGVGTAVFIPGMVNVNGEDSSDHLGHMIIDVDGDPCICGNRGCLETFVSIGALKRRFAASFPTEFEAKQGEGNISVAKYNDSWESSKELSEVKIIVDQLSNNESALSHGLLNECSEALGAGIKNFVTIIRPSKILMGGRVAKQMPDLVEQSIEKARENPLFPMFNNIDFLYSDFSPELLIRGGAYQVFDNYIGLIKPVSM
jgi:predicted NBD/HSP70 family sugar kinase